MASQQSSLSVPRGRSSPDHSDVDAMEKGIEQSGMSMQVLSSSQKLISEDTHVSSCSGCSRNAHTSEDDSAFLEECNAMVVPIGTVVKIHVESLGGWVDGHIVSPEYVGLLTIQIATEHNDLLRKHVLPSSGCFEFCASVANSLATEKEEEKETSSGSSCDISGVKLSEDDPEKHNGMEFEEAAWICPSCDEINREGETACNKCRTCRGDGECRWICPTCEEINSGKRALCNNCYKARPKPMVPDRHGHPELKAGLRVRCIGLKSYPELNGAYCILKSFNPKSGRWAAELENDCKIMNFRPENLQHPAAATIWLMEEVCDQGDGIRTNPTELQNGRAFQQRKPQRPELETLRTGADLKELRYIERSCKSSGQRFIDSSFSPEIHDSRFPAVVWCRPEEIAYNWDGQRLNSGKDWQLFRGDPRAKDVEQGVLGDCWLLSALAALADFRAGRFVRALFPQQTQLNPHGVYCVRLCLGGRWRNIIVDDRLPCGQAVAQHSNSTLLLYCATQHHQLWASLVEKAFAKVCGSYEALDGGTLREGLAVLTGWPCQLFCWPVLADSTFKKDFWTLLESCRDASFLMACGTRGKPVESTGLSPNHAYTLIDVIRIGDLQLLKMRNPDGKKTWQGAWSDSSSEWTFQFRKLLKLPPPGYANTGTFFMCLDDFLQYFDGLTVCEICADEWYEVRQLVSVPQNGKLPPYFGFEIVASAHTSCCIHLHQFQERLKGGMYNKSSEPLSYIGFVIMSLYDGSLCGIKEVVSVAGLELKDVVSQKLVLHPGQTYLLVPFCFYVGARAEFTLHSVSRHPADFKEVPLEPRMKKAARDALDKDTLSRYFDSH